MVCIASAQVSEAPVASYPLFLLDGQIPVDAYEEI